MKHLNEISSKKNFWEVDWIDLWNYKDLLFLFVKRDFISVYKQTILGPLWFFIQPVFTTIIFTIIFGQLAEISTDGLPKILFYMSGITCWNYFSDCLNKTSNVFISNAPIFGKVYFPRLIIPISIVISNLIKFGIQFLLFIGFLFYYKILGVNIQTNVYIFILPLLIILMAGLGLGLGILISSLTTKYRDLQFLVGFGVQLFMYATPIVYPLSLAKEKLGEFSWVLLANPMTPVIEAMKFSFLGEGYFSWAYLLYSFSFMILLLLFSIIIFSKVEQTFMDTV